MCVCVCVRACMHFGVEGTDMAKAHMQCSMAHALNDLCKSYTSHVPTYE